MNFAVLGGDARMSALARLLASDGHRVEAPPDAGALPDALAVVDVVILPLPCSLDGASLNAPGWTEPVTLSTLLERLSPRQRLLAGRADAAFLAKAAEKGVPAADYYLREELTVKNAALTAEGAVQLMLKELPVSVQGTRMLVTGFGRIGKLLALKLRALGADVTVSARRTEDFAWAEALGLRFLDTRALAGRLGGFRAVVNTVPAPVLTEALLGELDRNCLCVELASSPGGIDFAAAERLGLRTVRAPNLPGKTAPEAAGAAIRDTIYHMIAEWECGA